MAWRWRSEPLPAAEWLALGLILATTAAFLAGLGRYPVLDEDYPRVFARAAVLAAPLALLALLGYRALRRREGRPLRGGQLAATMAVILMLCTLLATGTVLLVNGLLSPGPPRERLVRVERVVDGPGRENTWAEVSGWRRSPVRLRARPRWDAATVAGWRPGEVLRVVTHDGLLGVEWIAAAGRVDPPGGSDRAASSP